MPFNCIALKVLNSHCLYSTYGTECWGVSNTKTTGPERESAFVSFQL